MESCIGFPRLIGHSGPRGDQRRLYEFDTCFPPEATQEEVAAQVMPLVQSALARRRKKFRTPTIKSFQDFCPNAQENKKIMNKVPPKNEILP